MPILPVDPKCPDLTALNTAAEVIRKGGIVGYPTETVYGLGVHALNAEAVEKLFRLKGRGPAKAISVLASDRAMLNTVVQEVPKPAIRLMDAFWPGPLTLVFKAASGLPSALLGGGDTIAVRISSNPIATALVAQLGEPLTSSSANRSGQPAARSAYKVQQTFGDSVDLIIDGGPSTSNVPSTLVHVSRGGMEVLREGRISGRKLYRVMEGISRDGEERLV